MRGKGTKLGEGCPKVRLSQDRMTILRLSPSLASLSGLLRSFGIITFGTITFGIVTYGKIA